MTQWKSYGSDLREKKAKSVLRKGTVNVFDNVNRDVLREQIIPGDVRNRGSKGGVNFRRDSRNNRFVSFGSHRCTERKKIIDGRKSKKTEQK